MEIVLSETWIKLFSARGLADVFPGRYVGCVGQDFCTVCGLAAQEVLFTFFLPNKKTLKD